MMMLPSASRIGQLSAPMRSVPSLFLLLGLASACSLEDSGPIGGAGAPNTGGASSQAGTGGMVAQAGTGGPSGTGGSVSQAGTGAGGTAGQATAGQTSTAGSAGAGTGGTAAGGASGTGGLGGSAGSGSGGAMQSGGCGKAPTLKNGTITISSGGASRKYILRVPDAYENTHPYRLVFAFAESGSSAMSVATRNYFTLATLDSKNTIFVAPDAANGMGSWSKSDVELTDAILAQVEGDLCIDKSRIFATGFSFGGAMSLALACTRADVFRGVAFFSGADLTGSCPATLTKPIAYYASQASGDSSGDPMPSSGRVKQAQFAAVNGCTAEPSATTFPAAGQPHKCTDYKGCSAGHPTKYCVFDGPHGWEPKDPGQSMSWNAPEAWKFITQF
jgi:poly(3-hydroxybutyrate) depolymerase